MDEVQRLADGLAETLQRSVEIDDSELRALAITEQLGALDDVRVQAVLARRSSAQVVDHVFSADLRTATGPVRYPANPDLGTLPRVCLPVRTRDELHGYLWLIDSPPLEDDEIAVALEVAREVAAVLHERDRQTKSALDRESSLVERLVDPAAPLPTEAAGHEELLAFGDALTMVTVLIRPAGGGQRLDAGDLRSLAHEVSDLRPTGRSRLGFGKGAVRLIMSYHASAGERLMPFLRAASRAAKARDWTVAGAGIGPAAHDLAELRAAAPRSGYAAAIAGARGVPLLAWAALGADAAFFGIPWSSETVELFSPGVSPLLEAENRQLRETVEVYLECGGDTQAAAERLAVHRTTLYYRLGRVRQLLGDDWSRGERRLGLHLALRLAHLLRLDAASSTPPTGN